MIDARLEGLEGFDLFTTAYRQAGPRLRKEMRKAVSSDLSAFVSELKSAAAGLDIKNVDSRRSEIGRSTRSGRGTGNRQRAVYDTARSLRARAAKGTLTDDLIDRRLASKVKSSGLRRKIASSIKANISTRGGDVRIRVKTNRTVLPENQRTLIAYSNSRRGWRHPLFGDRDHWYGQKAFPEAWWKDISEEHKRITAANIGRAFEQWLRTTNSN